MARPAGTGPTNSTLLGVSAPPGSTSASPPSPFLASARFSAQIAPPTHHAPPPAAFAAEPTASSFRTTPGLGSVARPVRPPGSAASGPTTAHAPPRAPRVGWRLVAVIVVAGAFGVIAAWVATRTDHARTPQAAGGVPPGASLSAADAGSLDASPEPPSVAPAAAADLLDAATTPADAAAAAAAPSDARSPASGDASPHRRTPAEPGPPPTASEPAAVPSSSPPRPAPAKAASPAPAPRAAAPATAAESLFDTLHALYERNDHAGVVRACTQTTVTVAIARVCLLAACHVRDTERAQRWLMIHPAEVRDKLVAYCKQLGSEIKT
jgi:hypothetical protein